MKQNKFMGGVVQMRIIGITGTTGAGKSTVCEELRKRGADIVDADRISRDVTRKNGAAFNEIVAVFGEEILENSGEIDRKKLGAIVFGDNNKLSKLNEITHKYIYDEMRRQILNSKADIVVLDVPLLFQPEFPFECDLTVAVVSSPEMRLGRIMARDGISRDAALLRIKSQISDSEYEAKADVCLKNDGEINRITKFVDDLIGENI